MPKTVPVLTIDGPSDPARARSAGWSRRARAGTTLDSGALYRAVGLAAAWEQVDLSDEAAVAACAARADIRFETARPRPAMAAAEPRVIVNGRTRPTSCGWKPPGGGLGHRRVAGGAGGLVDLQRGYRRAPGLVADGRDMGTVIFPTPRPRCS